MKTNRRLNPVELDEVRIDIDKYGPLKASEAHRLRFPRIFHALTGIDYLGGYSKNNSLDNYFEGGLVFDLADPRYQEKIKTELRGEDLINEGRIKAMRDFKEIKLTGEFDKLPLLEKIRLEHLCARCELADELNKSGSRLVSGDERRCYVFLGKWKNTNSEIIESYAVPAGSVWFGPPAKGGCNPLEYFTVTYSGKDTKGRKTRVPRDDYTFGPAVDFSVSLIYGLAWLGTLTTLGLFKQICDVPSKRRFEDKLLEIFQEQWEKNKMKHPA